MKNTSNHPLINEPPNAFEIDMVSHELYWRQFSAGLEASKILLAETADTELATHFIKQELIISDLRADKAKVILEASIIISEKAKLQVEYDEVKKVADIDPLTKLVNRRGAEDKYRRLQGGASSTERRISSSGPVESQVMVIDVDNFKQTNDKHGHGTGDELLQAIAEIMQKNTRSNDIVARWGGDEFVIIMPRAPLERVDDAAEAIRQEVKDLNRRQPYRTSVSIGIGKADFRFTLSQIVDIADKALINAKENGKNVVVHFDDMIEPTA